MTKYELEKRLKRAGFIKYPGGKHDVWVQQGFPPIPVPRHKDDVSIGTLKHIMKSAKLEKKR